MIRGLTVFILILNLCGIANAQKRVEKPGFYDVKSGTYVCKSLSMDLFKPTYIEPQAHYTGGEKMAFIYVGEKVVALFDCINDDGQAREVGVLAHTSIVEVDSIFYREIFRDPDPKKPWSLTFNVWYAIKINGKKYYTDYKIHDFVAMQLEMKLYHQKMLVVAQSTGYDEFYDNSYPNEFFPVVLDEKDEIIFQSAILDFDYRDEFWAEDVTSHQDEKGFHVVIGTPNYNSTSATWDGKSLKQP